MGKLFPQMFGNIIYFPFWWYSFGFAKIVVWSKNFLSFKLKKLGILVWLKNIFTPMYGQRDVAGFLISFFMRFIQIIFRTIVFVVWIFIVIFVVLFWLLFPILTIYQIFFQLTILLAK